MPANIVGSFAKKTGKSEAEIEKLWDKAKDIVKNEYPDVSENDERFFQLLVGVLKRMLKLTEQNVPGTTTADVAKFYKRMVNDKEAKKRKKEFIDLVNKYMK